MIERLPRKSHDDVVVVCDRRDVDVCLRNVRILRDVVTEHDDVRFRRRKIELEDQALPFDSVDGHRPRLTRVRVPELGLADPLETEGDPPLVLLAGVREEVQVETVFAAVQIEYVFVADRNVGGATRVEHVAQRGLGVVAGRRCGLPPGKAVELYRLIRQPGAPEEIEIAHLLEVVYPE